jgi:hypothetical protein
MKVLGSRVRREVTKRLARGAHLVVGNVGKYVLQGIRPWLRAVRVDRWRCHPVRRPVAEHRQERSILQEQKTPGFVIERLAMRKVQRVRGRGRVQADDAGFAHQHLRRSLEQCVPERLRCDPAIEKLDDFP